MEIWVCIRDDTWSINTWTFVLAKTIYSSLRVHVDETLGLLPTLEWVYQLHLGHIDFKIDAKKNFEQFFICTS